MNLTETTRQLLSEMADIVRELQEDQEDTANTGSLGTDRRRQRSGVDL